jgi:hypothetical protein
MDCGASGTMTGSLRNYSEIVEKIFSLESAKMKE